ncbi:MAG: hypothetical protein K8T20_09355, partial [Planctomycetes bacterium]|nr:hypothetical protein [Planctomycetota bacterium]
LRDRWIYLSTNLLVDKNADDAEALFRRAAKAGYNGVLLSDSKFSRLEDMEKRYFANVERLKKVAAELKLEIVPAVFPIGYSEGLLSRDPDLAEGLPVRDALFVVKDGEARVVADPPVVLKGGDMADLKKWDWHDETVVADNGAARVTDPKGRNARIVQKVKVAPFRQYHISVRVKTDQFKGEPRVAVLAGERSFNYANLGVKPTQDWTEHHVVFNSLEATEVGIYLGAWGADTGSLWWDDAKIEEAGPVNLVRRDGAPLVVKKDGGEALVEGTDFEKLTDPRTGVIPWRGGFEVWHEAPPLRTKLPDGTKLRVSYFHAITVGDGQVMVCPSEPRTLDLLRDEMKRVHAAFGAKAYFMSHDEIRVLNWDDACTKRGLSPGAILADNVKACTKIVREVAPDARIFVWSDMFDPNHNAHASYYLVNGDLKGSWEGLDKDVIIACWYFEKRVESLKFFADRGHKTLIAGYYDSNPKQILKWLEAGTAEGVMYTTWQQKYSDLEDFAALLKSK